MPIVQSDLVDFFGTSVRSTRVVAASFLTRCRGSRLPRPCRCGDFGLVSRHKPAEHRFLMFPLFPTLRRRVSHAEERLRHQRFFHAGERLRHQLLSHAGVRLRYQRLSHAGVRLRYQRLSHAGVRLRYQRLSHAGERLRDQRLSDHQKSPACHGQTAGITFQLSP